LPECKVTEDLKKIEVPVLVLHGDDDQIVPISESALLSVKLLKKQRVEVVQRLSAWHGNDPRRHHQQGLARLLQGVRSLRTDLMPATTLTLWLHYIAAIRHHGHEHTLAIIFLCHAGTA
jgi:hypothetical protein